jgi:UDP-N-acetyl-D-mannosaminuronate dehydrogenase
MNAKAVVAVVGLGYVGLPLAVEFGKRGRTLGFDLSATKIANYRNAVDPTGEVATDDLAAAVHLEVGTDPSMLAEADFIIIAVPTPVDLAPNPDFTPLAGATETVGRHMKRGAIVVFESTVYPGATEEVYLTHKAEMIGYHPQVILAGRRINDGMAKFVAEKTVKSMISSGFHVKGSKVNVVGLTFKENCPDLRNSKVADIVHELESYGFDVHVHDPLADPDEARHEYGIELESWDSLPRSDALVVAVGHREVMAHSSDEFCATLNDGGGFIDVKAQFDPRVFSKAGHCVWRL